MDDKLKKLIALLELKNEEKFSSFTESIKQLDKQDFELSSDIKLLFDEIKRIESDIYDTEILNQIEEIKSSIENIQLQKGEDGKDGLNGKDGINGKDGKDGKDGRDGIDGLDGINGKDGENGSPDTAEDIVNKINTLESVIERKTIKGLDNLVDQPGLDRALGILDQRTQYLINKTVVQPNLSGYVPTTRTLTINGVTEDLSADRSWSVGTVTDVAALTLGTTGTDLSSTVATGTTTPVITLNVPTASATNRGALSSTDWSTFNAKESALTFSTGLTRATNTITANLSTGISGGQTVVGGTASGNNLTLSSTSNATKGKIIFGTSAYDEVNNRLGIGTTTPNWKLHVAGTVGADNIIAQFGDANKGVNIKTLANGTGLITSWSYAPTDPSAIAISAGANFGFNAAPNNFYGMGLGAARNGKYDMWFQTGTANGGGYRWYTGGTNERMTINKDGKVGIGTTTPTALLMLAAGTATANTAPLKFTTGTNTTVAVAGQMEYNNTFHLTNSDATRRHVVTAPNTTKVTAAAPYTNDGYIIVNIGGIDFKLMTTA